MQTVTNERVIEILKNSGAVKRQAFAQPEQEAAIEFILKSNKLQPSVVEAVMSEIHAAGILNASAMLQTLRKQGVIKEASKKRGTVKAFLTALKA